MVHTMNLQARWFNYMKNGTKRIELRLNDEKRQAIQPGDQILFQSGVDSLLTVVKGKITSSSFADLFDGLPNMALYGDASVTKGEMLKIMEQFYPREKQLENGVVGIIVSPVNGQQRDEK